MAIYPAALSAARIAAHYAARVATTGLVTSYTLDGNGQPLSRTTGDNVTLSYAYDGLSRLISVSSGPSLSITYGYDAAGRRTQMVDATGTTTYQYDSLGRLTAVAAPGGTLGYTYDRDSNRTTLGYPGGTQNVTYTYTKGGRLDRLADWDSRTSTYSYFASGLVKDGLGREPAGDQRHRRGQGRARHRPRPRRHRPRGLAGQPIRQRRHLLRLARSHRQRLVREREGLG